MLFTIQRRDNSNVEWSDVIQLDPTTNVRRNGEANPKADTAQGALRAYGLAAPKKDGTAVSRIRGRQYRAIPMLTGNSKPVVTLTPTNAPNVSDDTPYGRKADGTPRKRPGRKPANPVAAPVTVEAPYGLKLDGTPAKRRGRKPVVTRIAPDAVEPAPASVGAQDAAKIVITAMTDGAMDFDQVLFEKAVALLS